MKKNKNTDMPIGDLTQIEDFLPAPHQLVAPDETVKVTISLTRTSLQFFKREAKKTGRVESFAAQTITKET